VGPWERLKFNFDVGYGADYATHEGRVTNLLDGYFPNGRGFILVHGGVGFIGGGRTSAGKDPQGSNGWKLVYRWESIKGGEINRTRD